MRILLEILAVSVVLTVSFYLLRDAFARWSNEKTCEGCPGCDRVTGNREGLPCEPSPRGENHNNRES